ncbi:hypothetical protein EDE15_1980 [Edaphobacter aggregans]|jgi:hypothetical protein|uniref:Uncharacterized protein n=1 Tax=Edaphobacter aggregans TaxID=570835 RepID=A0A428MHQ9_9BACT|nr:hypothetical protein [Edaphobacter aggregans]RSL16464.1 hypothetical protein EDE15_1980 [Edaphobacter aggregans]
MGRISLVGLLALILAGRIAAQELDPDPNRVFVTPLKWERVAGAPRDVKSADGTLTILYLEGVYAEVKASFIKSGGKQPIGLNLNEGFVLRLGTWSRTEDDILIRVQSREVVREKQLLKLICKSGGDSSCKPVPEGPLPGPLTTNTCRLERPSPTHIADTIVCSGLVVDHASKAIDLSDLPAIVRQVVAAQKKESSAGGR